MGLRNKPNRTFGRHNDEVLYNTKSWHTYGIYVCFAVLAVVFVVAAAGH